MHLREGYCTEFFTLDGSERHVPTCDEFDQLPRAFSLDNHRLLGIGHHSRRYLAVVFLVDALDVLLRVRVSRLGHLVRAFVTVHGSFGEAWIA